MIPRVILLITILLISCIHVSHTAVDEPFFALVKRAGGLGVPIVGPGGANDENKSKKEPEAPAAEAIIPQVPLIKLTNKNDNNEPEKGSKDPPVQLPPAITNKQSDNISANNHTSKNKDIKNNDEDLTKTDDKAKHKISALDKVESGTMVRGLIVFVALSILFMLYLAYRNYRSSRGRKHRAIVTKYGVRTRRNDVEMTPLPLDDDDEDETVFQLAST